MVPMCTWVWKHPLGHDQPVNSHIPKENFSVPMQLSSKPHEMDGGQ